MNEFNRILVDTQDKHPLRFYCPPSGVAVGQMQLIIVKYLRDRPAELHKPFILLAINALKEQFPCSTKPN